MESLERVILTFLVNSLWQVPLLTVLGWAIAWLLESAPARYRHRSWVCALVLALIAPLASALVSPPARAHTASGGQAGVSGLLVDAKALGHAAAKGIGLPARHVIVGLGPAIVMAYLALLLAQSIRLAAGWRRAATLVRHAGKAPSSLCPLIESGHAVFGRRVPVLVSDRISVPLTFGVVEPVVVIPGSFATPARGLDLRGVLVHEFSHVARNDCAVNLLCELVALPLAFHPATRFLKRRIGGARETACDEAAADFVGPRVYAQTLLAVAARACPSSRLAGALSALDSDSLEERMKRILDTRKPMRRRAAATLLVAGIAGLGLAVRASSDAAVSFISEAGPEDMIGQWTGKVAGGPLAGQTAADLRIKLTPQGPDITLTLYRYELGSAPGKPGKAEPLPILRHSVLNGVLRFRTRVEDFQLRAEDPPSAMEADWQFVIVGKDAGELTALGNSKLEAEKAQGKDVPPPPPPLAMTRTATPTP